MLPGAEAVALWEPPGRLGGEVYWAEHGERFAVEMEGELDRLGQITSLMSDLHPTEDHWYLLALGVRPDLQGRGLGSLMLAHTLAIADEQGLPAYLEATSARSRVLYARFGFEVVAEFAPADGPTLWAMRRPADCT